MLGCLALGLRVWAVAWDVPDRPHPPVVSMAAGTSPTGDVLQPTAGAIRKIVQLVQCLLGVATVFALAMARLVAPAGGAERRLGGRRRTGRLSGRRSRRRPAAVGALGRGGSGRAVGASQHVAVADCPAGRHPGRMPDGSGWRGLAGRRFPPGRAGSAGPFRRDRVRCAGLDRLVRFVAALAETWPAYAVFAAAALTCCLGKLPLRAMAPVAPIAYVLGGDGGCPALGEARSRADPSRLSGRANGGKIPLAATTCSAVRITTRGCGAG